ncbi:hypothetical protein DPMN_019841 [Dreissena polymorpha]|uniref:Uncharacterized protein n=1 Tax=Dreissena polymorpha TaxID=45954 RepID=A0A9D4NK11_DREPO|nr:hypothetical protein DPMN_019841 [Dreissena polymorpha]
MYQKKDLCYSEVTPLLTATIQTLEHLSETRSGPMMTKFLKVTPKHQSLIKMACARLIMKVIPSQTVSNKELKLSLGAHSSLTTWSKVSTAGFLTTVMGLSLLP